MDALYPEKKAVMDGFQLCHTVKKGEVLKRIPFVFYTATYTNKKDEKFALLLGANRFIRTPMVPDKFIEILHGVLGDVEAGEITPKEPAVKRVENDLTFIENAVTSMGRLLDDTREFSRTGRVMNSPEDVPFKALVRDAGAAGSPD